MRLLLLAVALVPIAACHDGAVPNTTRTVLTPTLADSDPWADVETAMGIAQPARHKAGASAPPVSSLIGRLEARAEADPGNAGHWTLLAQSYAHVGRDADAERAVSRAVALGADEALLRSQIERAGAGR